MNKNFIYWPRVQLYESSLSFTQCQRRLPFKTLTICQESTLFKYTCNSTWATSPPHTHSPPLHETKENKKQNHPKWMKLWFSISIHPADFQTIFREQKKKKTQYELLWQQADVLGLFFPL